MKYELIKWDLVKETEADIDGNYSVTITIALHPTDGIAPDFSKDIVVVSNNNETGFEVDESRVNAVNDYITTINL